MISHLSCFLSLCLALIAQVGWAQVIVGDDCPSGNGQGSLCISLDASKSVDSLAGPQVFRWHLGDGQTRDGLRFDYCYTKPGQYKVRLDIIDSRTQEVRADEYVRILDLGDTPAPHFSGPDSVKVGRHASFSLDRSSLPHCLRGRMQLIWTLGEGNSKVGENVDYTFRKPGTYRVRLMIENAGSDPECPFLPCATRLVRVIP